MAPEHLHGDDAPASGWRVWWEAARPRTLPASLAPVLAGTAASDRVALAFGSPSASGPSSVLSRVDVDVLWGRAGLALVVALALQVAVNLANDYFDAVRGVDTPDRVGPRRVTAAGLVTPGRMRTAIVVALAVAGVAGLWLSLLVTPWLLLVGAAAGVAALGYSGGPRPYASAGLGELSVFVFFGLVASAGSQFVQDGAVNAAGALVGVAMGSWAVALLLVNNLRDIPTDTRAGKRTLAVRIGEDRTRSLTVACLVVPYVVAVALVVVAGEPWLALVLLSLPLAGPAAALVRSAPIGPRLVPALARTARSQLAYAVLVTVGLALRDPALSAVEPGVLG